MELRKKTPSRGASMEAMETRDVFFSSTSVKLLLTRGKHFIYTITKENDGVDSRVFLMKSSSSFDSLVNYLP